jgi:transketolase
MRDRFTAVSTELLDAQDDVVVVLADIGVDRFRAGGALARHPGRVVNLGIREQLLVSVAAGFALAGYRPIAHTYAPFLVERAFEQVKLDLVHQGLGAILVSTGASFDAAAAGRTHHAPGDVALMATLPDVVIHVPGHPAEVEAALRAASKRRETHYVRLAADTNRSPRPEALGHLVRVRVGSPSAPIVIAVGPMLDPVLAATADLDVSVAYTTTVLPFDHTGARAMGAGDVILVEPTLAGTSLPQVTAALADAPRRFLALGVGRVELRRYGHRRDHAAAHGLDPAGLRRRILDFTRSAAA